MDNLNRHCLLEHDGKWHMWFTGQARGYSWIGYADSDDGMHWTKMEQPVLISERPFEGPSVMNPFVMWDEENNRWLLWYNGRHEAAEYTGLVIHEGLDLGFDD